MDTDTTNVKQPTAVAPMQEDNGLSPERWAQIRRRLQERRDDPNYRAALEQDRIAAEEYRRQVNEEARRWLEDEGK
jgi:hypothetical protein